MPHLHDTLLIARREWRNLMATDKGALAMFAVVIAIYGLAIGLNARDTPAGTGLSGLWWLLFSVVVSSMFTNSTFVAERVTGSIEVLMTCGVSRGAVLLGKVLFSVSVAAIVGAVAALLSWGGSVMTEGSSAAGDGMSVAGGFLLFVTASWLNACSVAWLSVRLPNPRLSQFVNFVLVLTVGGALLSTGLSNAAAGGMLLVLGTGFFVLARRAYHSENVVTPAGI